MGGCDRREIHRLGRADDCEVQGLRFSPAVDPDRMWQFLITQPWAEVH
ncbi:MAG: hypothetical protein VW239_03690 [Candidatus Nanopelagicales bacterium]